MKQVLLTIAAISVLTFGGLYLVHNQSSLSAGATTVRDYQVCTEKYDNDQQFKLETYQCFGSEDLFDASQRYFEQVSLSIPACLSLNNYINAQQKAGTDSVAALNYQNYAVTCAEQLRITFQNQLCIEKYIISAIVSCY